MKKTASDIADEALHKAETLRVALRCNVARMKVAADDDTELSLPAILGLGVGGGAVAGTGSGLLSGFENLSDIRRLKGNLGELAVLRDKVMPPEITRKRIGELIRNAPPEQSKIFKNIYNVAFEEPSRARKQIKVFKNRFRRGLIGKGLLGTGAGLGAGLLAATALGHFD
jgi:hypothetical protein